MESLSAEPAYCNPIAIRVLSSHLANICTNALMHHFNIVDATQDTMVVALEVNNQTSAEEAGEQTNVDLTDINEVYLNYRLGELEYITILWQETREKLDDDGYMQEVATQYETRYILDAELGVISSATTPPDLSDADLQPLTPDQSYVNALNVRQVKELFSILNCYSYIPKKAALKVAISVL